MTLLKATIILLCGVMAFLVENSSGCWHPKPTTTPAPTMHPGHACCSGKTAGRNEPQMVPYTGGINPANHPGATVCFFHRNSKCLTCSTGPTSRSQCCTRQPISAHVIPLNEYLINTVEGGKYNLSPYNSATGGYLSHFQIDQSGTSGWNIHDGNYQGKGVAVNHECWGETKATIDQGYLTYNGIPLKGFLYVTDE